MNLIEIGQVQSVRNQVFEWQHLPGTYIDKEAGACAAEMAGTTGTMEGKTLPFAAYTLRQDPRNGAKQQK